MRLKALTPLIPEHLRRRFSGAKGDLATTTPPAPAKLTQCPICAASRFIMLSPVWKNYFDVDRFYITDSEWFVFCDQCGTTLRFPLLDYKEQYKIYGEDYYEQKSPELTVEQHVQEHFENFQKANYDVVESFLLAEAPPREFPRWLDVGSIGYITSSTNYRFTTIEPDERAVNVGRGLFQGGSKDKIVCATLETFETIETFDGILFNNSFYCVTTPKQTIEKAYRLLRDHGLLAITISTYLNDAVPYRVDGRILRIEDVLPGGTLWIFYNQFSLQYLLATLGFKLLRSTELRCYGKKTMQLYLFQKTREARPDKSLLQASRSHQCEKWEACFQSFIDETKQTLETFNKPQCFFVGSTGIFLDLLQYGSLDKITGFVPTDLDCGDFESQGIRFFSWADLERELHDKKGGPASIVVCSYKNQANILTRLRRIATANEAIFAPTRSSGLEALNFRFGSRIRPSKAFVVEQV